VAPWIDSPVVVGKREGDAVVAGASLVSGRLRVTATFTGPERAWLRLAQSKDGRVDVAAPLVVFARRVVERSVIVAAAIVAVAAAVLREARSRGIRPENVRSALVHAGLGVTALVSNGDKVIVGSRAFLLKEKVSVAISDSRVSELEAEGRSVLLVALGGRLI